MSKIDAKEIWFHFKGSLILISLGVLLNIIALSNGFEIKENMQKLREFHTLWINKGSLSQESGVVSKESLRSEIESFFIANDFQDYHVALKKTGIEIKARRCDVENLYQFLNIVEAHWPDVHIKKLDYSKIGQEIKAEIDLLSKE